MGLGDYIGGGVPGVEKVGNLFGDCSPENNLKGEVGPRRTLLAVEVLNFSQLGSKRFALVLHKKESNRHHVVHVLN